jgi:hypothetical protein
LMASTWPLTTSRVNASTFGQKSAAGSWSRMSAHQDDCPGAARSSSKIAASSSSPVLVLGPLTVMAPIQIVH